MRGAPGARSLCARVLGGESRQPPRDALGAWSQRACLRSCLWMRDLLSPWAGAPLCPCRPGRPPGPSQPPGPALTAPRSGGKHRETAASTVPGRAGGSQPREAPLAGTAVGRPLTREAVCARDRVPQGAGLGRRLARDLRLPPSPTFLPRSGRDLTVAHHRLSGPA